jgi:hypothetical protein
MLEGLVAKRLSSACITAHAGRPAARSAAGINQSASTRNGWDQWQVFWPIGNNGLSNSSLHSTAHLL